MEMKHCHSCGMPISGPGGVTARGNYCEYCSDENGNLKPREVVQAGIAQWLAGFSPNVTPEQCNVRAGHYMAAMPAWADQ
jgi:hypothetical protein